MGWVECTCLERGVWVCEVIVVCACGLFVGVCIVLCRCGVVLFLVVGCLGLVLVCVDVL